MGGEREDTIAQVKNDDAGKEVKCGKIRFHESQGEIHFHDDKNKLKVAIPSGVWFTQFQELTKNVPATIHYPDPKNGASLHVSTEYKKKKKRLELSMSLEELDVSEDLLKLQEFTEG
jgi:hypothetical protein